MSATIRIGVDLGGTKIAAIGLDSLGEILAEERTATPAHDYDGTLDAIADLVSKIENITGSAASVGVGTPGSIAPSTGRLQNANSTWLNGKSLDRDLQTRLGRPVRLANDANCFALSEAIDGAGAGAQCVFGVILGTGCGGGIVHDGRLIDGPRGIGGEWGHNPLPWPEPAELPGPECWCGKRGCMESWVSGPALARDHREATGETLTAEEIAGKALSGDRACQETLQRHASRLARGLAAVVNIVDPEVVVLGGGLSEMPHLYDALPDLMAPFIFASDARVTIRPPVHGSASGVRGAAWLWGRPNRP